VLLNALFLPTRVTRLRAADVGLAEVGLAMEDLRSFRDCHPAQHEEVVVVWEEGLEFWVLEQVVEHFWVCVWCGVLQFVLICFKFF